MVTLVPAISINRVIISGRIVLIIWFRVHFGYYYIHDLEKRIKLTRNSVQRKYC